MSSTSKRRITDSDYDDDISSEDSDSSFVEEIYDNELDDEAAGMGPDEINTANHRQQEEERSVLGYNLAFHPRRQAGNNQTRPSRGEFVSRSERREPLGDVDQLAPALMPCSCGRCPSNSTASGVICCKAFPYASEIDGCVCDDNDFSAAVFNETVLEIMAVHREIPEAPQMPSDPKRHFRHLAYRNATYVLHKNERLGRGNRVHLPGCVESKIRLQWPNAEGAYTGFLPSARQLADFYTDLRH